jgi:hypothetical protein
MLLLFFMLFLVVDWVMFSQATGPLSKGVKSAAQMTLSATQVSISAAQMATFAAQMTTSAAQIATPAAQVTASAAYDSLPVLQVSIPVVQGVPLPAREWQPAGTGSWNAGILPDWEWKG